MGVLVTGGAGFVGSHVVMELLAAGEQVTVLDDLSTGSRSAVSSVVDLVLGDVGDASLVLKAIERSGADAVFHFAGSVVVPESVERPLHYYLNNSCKSRTLIECVCNANVRHFIFSSSAAVYGVAGENPVTEKAATLPISPYGRSKLVTEMMLADASVTCGLTYTALRYFNVSGADPAGRAGQSNPRGTHLIKTAVQTALGSRPYIEVYGSDYPTPDGTCIRDYVHVSDLAQAHVAALAYLREGGSSQALNCGYGHGSSVLEVISSVERVTGTSLRVKLGPRRAGDVAALVADASRIRGTLGWLPRFDKLDEIVAHALYWERRLDTMPQPT